MPLDFGLLFSLGLFVPVGSAGVGASLVDWCCGGCLSFVLSFVTVGRWVIGRPLNGSRWSLLELFLWGFLGFLVLVLLTVHFAQ